MRISPQISGVSIISIGNFNPLIFRPDWFKEKEILVGSDLDGVQVEVIHPEIVSFKLPWGQVNVDRDRFVITATQEPTIRAHDFFVATFQRLPETPITLPGINRDVHFEAGSQQALDRVGDTLAPKEFWGDFVKRDGKKIGGMRSIVMEQAILAERGGLARLDGAMGWIRVQVEPSNRVVPTGVYVQVNDHYDLSNEKKLADGKIAADLVAGKWEGSIKMAEELIDRIMGITIAI